ncbi:MAG: radical SAM family heme chaperone HemW [Paludibacteraceae bacterium]|nr:radical SAM family heme chaperone HemW [Paludibacteraceae bacterium]
MAGIYVHIPFCKSRCIYCDFYSTTQNENLQDKYVDRLCEELTARQDYLPTKQISTIYLGGGTPSTLSQHNIERLLKHIFNLYKLQNYCETTIECNPNDIRKDILTNWHNFGINRISFGVQTFDNSQLHFLHRRHTAEEAIQAIEEAKKCFDNISVDLIYGLPNQTLEMLDKDIDQILKLDIQHVSTYCLTYEEGTQLYKLKEEEKVAELDDDTLNLMYDRIIERLGKSSFEHYEVSNFCRPNFHSRHNMSYWTGEPYLGIGAAAHSFDGLNRQANEADLKNYLNGVQKVIKDPLNTTDRYNETIMLQLRTAKGIDLNKLKEQYGIEQYTYCITQAKSDIEQNNLIIENNFLRINKHGWHLLDAITQRLITV